MLEYLNETISDSIIDLNVKDTAHVIENCTFINCKILLYQGNPASYILGENVFNDCILQAKRPLSTDTIEATFESCSFEGKWETRFSKKLVNCDFSNANASFIEFYKNKSKFDFVLPQNHIVIEEPYKNLQDLNNRLGEDNLLTFALNKDVSLILLNPATYEKDEPIVEPLKGASYIYFS